MKDELHPVTGETVRQVCKRFKIDMRQRPFFWNGELVRNAKATLQCSGCDGNGCFECGYTGKRIQHFPELILHAECFK